MTPFDALAEVVTRFAMRHAGVTRSDPPTVELEVGVGGPKVLLMLVPPDGRPAAWSGRHGALRYRIAGALDPATTVHARRLLEELLRELVRLDAELASDTREIDDEAELARALEAGPPRAEAGRWLRLGPRLRRAPAALVPLIDAAHRRLAGRNDRLPAIEGLAPCLDLSMRPRPLGSVASAPDPLAPSCAGCAARPLCPAHADADIGAPPGLRTLRHADSLEATIVAAGTIAAQWGAGPIATPILRALHASRAGLGPHPNEAPVELSLKRAGDALAPVLRIVEYPVPARPGLPPHAQLATAWRARLRAHIATIVPTAVPRLDSFVCVVEGSAGPTLELSLGIELGLELPTRRAQLYAHIEPRDRQRMRGTLEAALTRAGTPRSSIAAVSALLDRCDLALLAASGEPEDGLKAYFTLPLTASDPALGIAPAEPRELVTVAADNGLAVVEAGPAGARLLKWDFPATPHFQRASEVYDAFLSPLSPTERARGRAILEAPAFQAWPTWLSVRPGASTLYFIPR